MQMVKFACNNKKKEQIGWNLNKLITKTTKKYNIKKR